MKKDLILYSVNNMYFRSIQAGIQAAHSAVELMAKYDKDKVYPISLFGENWDSPKELIMDWATNHKTMYVFNGGSHSMMRDFLRIALQSGLPYSTFYEVDCSPDCLSSISMVLPSIDYSALEDDANYFHLPKSTVDLYEALRKMRFAQ